MSIKSVDNNFEKSTQSQNTNVMSNSKNPCKNSMSSEANDKNGNEI